MITAIGNKVLVKVEEDNGATMQDGLLVSGARKDKPLKGVVVSLGEEVKYLSVGDHILCSSYGYDTISDGDEEYALVGEELVLCKIS